MALFKKKKEDNNNIENDLSSNKSLGVYIVVEDNKEIIHDWLNSIGIFPILVTDNIEQCRKKFNNDPDDTLLIIVESGKGKLSPVGNRDIIHDLLMVNNENFDEGLEKHREEEMVEEFSQEFSDEDDDEFGFDFEEEAVLMSSKRIVRLVYTDENLKDDMRRRYLEYVKNKVNTTIPSSNFLAKAELRSKLLKNESSYIKYNGIKAVYDAITLGDYRLLKYKPFNYKVNVEEILRHRVTGLPPEASRIAKNTSYTLSDEFKDIASNLDSIEEKDKLEGYKVKI